MGLPSVLRIAESDGVVLIKRNEDTVAAILPTTLKGIRRFAQQIETDPSIKDDLHIQELFKIIRR